MIDWNSLTPALKSPTTHLPDLAGINEYRQFLIEAFQKHAVKDLRLIFNHYFSEFADRLGKLNAIHYRNQMRLLRKHPAVDRVVTYVLNDPTHCQTLADSLCSERFRPSLTQAADSYFNEHGQDWLINQFELQDFERPDIKRPQFMAVYVKLCQSGHRREIWRALQNFSGYIARNPDLMDNTGTNSTMWDYRKWIFHNFS